MSFPGLPGAPVLPPESVHRAVAARSGAMSPLPSTVRGKQPPDLFVPSEAQILDAEILYSSVPGDARTEEWESAVNYVKSMAPQICAAAPPSSGKARGPDSYSRVTPLTHMTYPSWVSPHIEAVSDFYLKHKKLFEDISTEDVRCLLSTHAQLYSWCNSQSKDLYDFIYGKGRRSTLFTVKALACVGCTRAPTHGDSFTIKDSDHNIVLDYVYKDKTSDANTYLWFVQHMLSRSVAGSGYEAVVADPRMSKYNASGDDAMVDGRGLDALNRQRDYRTQFLRHQKLLKMAMTTTSSLPCTLDKVGFGSDVDPDPSFVLLYGSGDSSCSMRHRWKNVYCVDPLWDGPDGTGFAGTHSQFHAALQAGTTRLLSAPDYIVSDACGYSDQRLVLMEGFRGANELSMRTRAMDPTVTNRISAEIVEFWVNRGYGRDIDAGQFFALKCGVDHHYPELFFMVQAHGSIKTRPTNAEVFVLLKGEYRTSADDLATDSPPPGDTVSWARTVARHNTSMWVANHQRMYHERTRTFPVRGYSYPENFGSYMRNARRNVTLKVPSIYSDYSRSDDKARKAAMDGLDLDDLEHSSVSSSYASSCSGRMVSGGHV